MQDTAAVLVIGGTDSSGGAGLSRDLRVLADCEVMGVPVVTAVTAQTHAAVCAIHTVPPGIIREQIAAAMESNEILAIKIGMLGTGAIVRAVLDELPDRREIPIIADPVLCSTSGAVLLDPEGLQLLRDHLLPRCSLMTPNLIEASGEAPVPPECPLMST